MPRSRLCYNKMSGIKMLCFVSSDFRRLPKSNAISYDNIYDQKSWNVINSRVIRRIRQSMRPMFLLQATGWFHGLGIRKILGIYWPYCIWCFQFNLCDTWVYPYFWFPLSVESPCDVLENGIDLSRTLTFCFSWTFISKNFLFEIGMEKASRNATKKFRFSRKYFNLYSNSLQSWEYFELRAIFLSWLRAVDTTQIISIQIQYWEGLFKKCLDNKTLSSSASISISFRNVNVAGGIGQIKHLLLSLYSISTVFSRIHFNVSIKCRSTIDHKLLTSFLGREILISGL